MQSEGSEGHWGRQRTRTVRRGQQRCWLQLRLDWEYGGRGRYEGDVALCVCGVLCGMGGWVSDVVCICSGGVVSCV